VAEPLWKSWIEALGFRPMTDADLPARLPIDPVGSTVHELHGVRRVDDYAGLRDVTREETLAFLAAERAHYDARVEHTGPLREQLYGRMSRLIAPADESARWMRAGIVYYTRTVPGKEYTQFLRESAGNSSAQVLLDENDLAEGADYFSLGVRSVSPDARLLAYSVDRTGDEVYELAFRDLETGTDRPDRIARSYYGGAWSADSGTFFYTVHDDSYRPFQVWRHRLGTAATDDRLVYQEDDDRFEVSVSASRSGGLVVIDVFARESTEVWLVPADRPEEAPVVVEPRRPGVEYRVAHAPRPDGDVLLVVTNDGAAEFRLMRAPLASPGRAHWEELVAEHPEERLVAADVFAGHLVLTLRRDGYPVLRIVPRVGLERAVDVGPGLEGGTIELDHNEEFATDEVLVAVRSYTEPTTWYAVDLDTGTRELRHREAVPGYDPAAYVSSRLQLPARDGALVPVTVVRRADVPLDGTAPCLLYGYGSYEYSEEPAFDPALVRGRSAVPQAEHLQRLRGRRRRAGGRPGGRLADRRARAVRGWAAHGRRLQPGTTAVARGGGRGALRRRGDHHARREHPAHRPGVDRVG
jgi:oligopeptidase B